MGEREELLALAQIIDGRPTQYAPGGFAVEDDAPASDQALLKAKKILDYLSHAQCTQVPSSTLYLERSAVRSLLTGVGDDDVHVAEGILADVDNLPTFTAEEFAALRAPEAADAGAVGIDRLCDFIEETQERLGPGCDELALAEAIVAKFNVRDLTGKGASPAADAGMRKRDNECLKFALKTARNHLITLGGDGRPDPNADQLQAAILDLIDATLPSTERDTATNGGAK